MLWWPRGVSVKPSAAKSRAARSRSLTAITAWSIGRDGGKRLEEALGGLVADHAQALHFAPVRVEEDDARRAEEREALEERAVLGRIGRHVDLQEQHAVERALHARVA